jgi:hypothetical protein
VYTINLNLGFHPQIHPNRTMIQPFQLGLDVSGFDPGQETWGYDDVVDA